MQETYYTVEQIAQMLQMHPKTVQRYIREGKLRAVKVGKGWRISGHDLSTFTECTPTPGETPTTVVSCVADVFRGPERAQSTAQLRRIERLASFIVRSGR